MKTVRITAKNYRCFSDTSPLCIDLAPGFTAFVGPNNSGKSTALKLFFEFRDLFTRIQSINSLAQLLNGSNSSIGPLGTIDAEEVFCNSNERPLSIDIACDTDRQNVVSLLRLTCQRATNLTFGAEFFAGPNREPLPHLSTQPRLLQDNTVHEHGASYDGRWLFELGRTLAGSLYVGPFRNAITEGQSSYFDLEIGTAFIRSWDDWKTGDSRDRNRIAQTVTRQLEGLFGYSRLELSATTNKNMLQAVIGDDIYRLNELGAGLSQFLVVLANVAMRKPTILLIDEPELHLHPRLQSTFLMALSEHVKTATLFSTHSLGLARSTAETVYSLHKDQHESRIDLLSGTAGIPEFLGEMSFSAHRELGCEGVLLVEGTSEVKAIQEFLRKLNKDHKYLVVPLGGSSMINAHSEAEMAEFQRISSKIAVLIDSERSSMNAPLSPGRQQFVDSCRALGFTVHTTERRAFENYLPDTAIKAQKGDKYHALNPYEALTHAKHPWAKHENWKIAARMSATELLETDVGAFLSTL